jgi:hypothetical protein
MFNCEIKYELPQVGDNDHDRIFAHCVIRGRHSRAG